MKGERAQEILTEFRHKRIAVFGDLMLDRYIWGSATRISQEAPVPIVAVQRQSAAPGGAANVLRNISALGAQASAHGVIGDDTAAADLLEVLQAQGVDTAGVVQNADRATTEKTRIIADHQQVVRVDVEKTAALEPKEVDSLLQRLEAEAATGSLHAIIVEDYNKGAVTEPALQGIADLARRHDLLVALDPHPGNTAHAQGITVMTPNRAEAFAMAGRYLQPPVQPVQDDQPLREVVRLLQERWHAQNLLVTLGADGMALFHKDELPLHIPTLAREVFDVSGAGDTVVASFVLSLLAGASPEEAAVISNHAAGVVVGKVGTAPVSPEEIIQSFQAES